MLMYLTDCFFCTAMLFCTQADGHQMRRVVLKTRLSDMYLGVLSLLETRRKFLLRERLMAIVLFLEMTDIGYCYQNESLR